MRQRHLLSDEECSISVQLSLHFCLQLPSSHLLLVLTLQQCSCRKFIFLEDSTEETIPVYLLCAFMIVYSKLCFHSQVKQAEQMRSKEKRNLVSRSGTANQKAQEIYTMMVLSKQKTDSIWMASFVNLRIALNMKSKTVG